MGEKICFSIFVCSEFASYSLDCLLVPLSPFFDNYPGVFLGFHQRFMQFAEDLQSLLMYLFKVLYEHRLGVNTLLEDLYFPSTSSMRCWIPKWSTELGLPSLSVFQSWVSTRRSNSSMFCAYLLSRTTIIGWMKCCSFLWKDWFVGIQGIHHCIEKKAILTFSGVWVLSRSVMSDS